MQPHLCNKVMHDVCNYDAYFVQKCDAAGVLGLLPEQKRSHNDLNVLSQSPVFNDVLRREASNITYEI
ncbi:unnamed protein product, partial [Prunus brigantina]